MVLCASCKNKTSLEQCTSTALKGLQFCGKHIKVRDKRIWAEVNKGNTNVILIQKIWRGYIIRKYLSLCGPGVLKRKACLNDDELVTLESKDRYYPLDYFSFDEADKLYWFDIRSLYQYIRNLRKPINPYTRQPITLETRRRLRELCMMRKRRNMFNLHQAPPPMELQQTTDMKWLDLCQILEENGFEEINYLYFSSLSRGRLHVFMNLIYNDMVTYAAEHTKPESRRKKYVSWIKSVIHNPEKSVLRASSYCVKTLLSILNDSKEPYYVCFTIVSALVRL